MVTRVKYRAKFQSPGPGKDRKAKPALAVAGKGGLEERNFAAYLVASARAPETGTTGDCIPILAQRK